MTYNASLFNLLSGNEELRKDLKGNLEEISRLTFLRKRSMPKELVYLPRKTVRISVLEMLLDSLSGRLGIRLDGRGTLHILHLETTAIVLNVFETSKANAHLPTTLS